MLNKKKFLGSYDDHLEKKTSIISNKSKSIDQKLNDEIISFFRNEVVPFAEKLNHYSEQMSNSLYFDVHEIYEFIKNKSEEISRKGDSLVAKLPKSTVKIVKNIFRLIVWPWISKSYFVKRGLLKPRGYPGDFEIVENMYNGQASSMGIGYIYDLIFLQTQLCQGLRNRKDQMKQILNNFIQKFSSNEEMSVINIGCGSSREIRELNIGDNKKIKFYLIDNDQDALDYSKEKINEKFKKAEVVLCKVDVVAQSLLETPQIKGLSEGDIIYSIGLFDYLPDRVLLSLISYLKTLIKKNGILVLTHKDYTKYLPSISDWFCNWKYYPRNKNDFMNILKLAGINIDKIKLTHERDGYIYFAIINKESLLE